MQKLRLAVALEREPEEEGKEGGKGEQPLSGWEGCEVLGITEQHHRKGRESSHSEGSSFIRRKSWGGEAAKLERY